MTKNISAASVKIWFAVRSSDLGKIIASHQSNRASKISYNSDAAVFKSGKHTHDIVGSLYVDEYRKPFGKLMALWRPGRGGDLIIVVFMDHWAVGLDFSY